MNQLPRRSFLRVLGTTTTALVLAPTLISCGSSSDPTTTGSSSGGETEASGALDLPSSRPADWDAVAFNRARANAGAAPASYLEAINAPDGDVNAIGKHLPYVPELPPGSVGPGMIAIMWGDPAKQHARHPNAVRDASNHMEGHWYDWIEIRRAVDAPSPTQRSVYPEWPVPMEGRFLVQGGGDITEDAGKNTVYLAALPEGVGPGDTVRVFAHCLTHGEYLDFLTLPG